jgi:hypothetical protein
MARKKNLAGLAALAGLAYMASRDKAVKGGAPVVDAPAAVPAAPSGGDFIEAGSGPSGDFMSEKEPGWESSTAPASKPASKPAATRSIAAPKLMTPEEGARAYRSRAPAGDPREALMRNYVPRRDPRASGAMSGDYMANSATSRGVRNMYERAAEEGMKKGGSVKGWGIARGARKARTY